MALLVVTAAELLLLALYRGQAVFVGLHWVMVTVAYRVDVEVVVLSSEVVWAATDRTPAARTKIEEASILTVVCCGREKEVLVGC